MKAKTYRCANCRKRIYTGNDAFSGERGVLGTRNFVPLKDREIFCSEECLSAWFSDVPSLVRRTP